jgi:polyphosphate kinase
MTAKRVAADPGRFFNRELSWLAFNDRVLEEASDASNPLLERVRFATIVASNLDEFFMVRVAGLKAAIAEGESRPDASGMTPERQLAEIARLSHDQLEHLHRLATTTLLPALGQNGIQVLDAGALTPQQRAAASAFFRNDVLPALTPLAIDVERPFPMLSGLSLNLAFWLEPPSDGGDRRLAVVQVPLGLPRLVRLTSAEGPTFVWLDHVIRMESAALFPGQQVLEATAFRLCRDSELELDDEGGESYLEVLEQSLRQRRRSDAVRLEVETTAGPDAVAHLSRLIEVEPSDVFRLPGPLDLRALAAVADLPGFDGLRFPPAPPVSCLTAAERSDMFTLLDRRDILLHHPYDSFDPVVAFVENAADDPDVLAIKQTLYRTSGDSPVVAALTRAADAGKQVTVLVELMARFDESRNIRWARRLEEMGAHVIYGIAGYKVHAKICLVVRRATTGLRRYIHLGTGNYNDGTARVYTDFGLLTSDPVIAADASAFWSALTGYSDPPRLRKLVMAPTALRGRLRALVEREQRRAEAGQPARIRAKMNALVDPEMISALYLASQAGVRIALNVRGICVLKPGVPNLSENISVTSVVGRYLEHARAFEFHNGGDDEVYLASADWMPRNLDRRIELMFPVEADQGRRKVIDALDALFRDNVKGRRLSPAGEWKVPSRRRGTEPFAAQMFLHQSAVRAAGRNAEAPGAFEPLGPPQR